jgi:hypothetical protein
LAALSECQNLVCLDLSTFEAAFRALDILRAVSTLSSLKIFHFPSWSVSAVDSGENDNGRSEKSPKWPDSLETLYMFGHFSPDYIAAFDKAPASLKNLIIEGHMDLDEESLDSVFRLIGP